MKNLLLLTFLLPVALFATKEKAALITLNNFDQVIAHKQLSNKLEAKGLLTFSGVFESRLEGLIQASRLYQLVDRSHLQALFKESDFNASGLVGSKAVQQYAMKGAGKVLVVEIRNVEYLTDSQTYNLTNQRDEESTLSLTITGKVINISTSVVEHVLPPMRVTLDQKNLQLRIGEQTGKSALWEEAAEKLAIDMARVLASAIRPAKILVVNGKQVMINQGSTTGFSPGSLVQIYATETIIDEETGEKFLNEIPVGTGNVVRGDARKAYIILSEDLGVTKGCIARHE